MTQRFSTGILLLSFISSEYHRNFTCFYSGTSKQTSYTYICEQSLNPIWVDQRFIFEIPPRVANEARGFTLRVVVKSRSITGFDQFLGRTDIQFNCLKEEKVLSGWFALRPASTSLASTMKYKYQAFDVTGSIKLNLQWIHTDIGLTAYMLKAIEW